MMQEPAPHFSARTWTTGPAGLRAVLENENSGDGATAGTATPPVPSVDVAKLQARLAEYELRDAEQAKTSSEQAERTKRDLEAAGEHKKLAELARAEADGLKRRVSELDADAQVGRSFRERETSRIEEAKKSLPDDEQRLVDQMPTIDLKAQVLDKLVAARGSGRRATPGAAGGPPPPAGVPIDFATLANDPKSLRAAKDANPAAWEAYKMHLRGPSTRQPTLADRMKLTLVEPAQKKMG